MHYYRIEYTMLLQTYIVATMAPMMTTATIVTIFVMLSTQIHNEGHGDGDSDGVAECVYDVVARNFAERCCY